MNSSTASAGPSIPSCFGNTWTLRSLPSSVFHAGFVQRVRERRERRWHRGWYRGWHRGWHRAAPAPGNPSRPLHKRVCIFRKHVLCLNDDLCKHLCVYMYSHKPTKSFPLPKSSDAAPFQQENKRSREYAISLQISKEN